MKTSAAIVPPPTNMNQQALFETDESSARQQALYTLIARQPFFEGLEPAHFKLLADSASEMRFEPGQVGGYLQSGKLKNKETIVEGLDQAESAFIGLFTGNNTGKMVVKLV